MSSPQRVPPLVKACGKCGRSDSSVHPTGTCYECRTGKKLKAPQRVPPKPNGNGLNSADYKPGTVVPCEKCGKGCFKSGISPEVLGTGPRCPDCSEAALEMKRLAKDEVAREAEEAKDAAEAAKPKKHEFELGKRDDGSALIGIRMSDVQSRAMKFLWPGRIPLGKGVVAQGLPGQGKSMAILGIAAAITNGADFPDGAKNELGARKVLWAGTEDDLEDTVKPRLQAAGANMDNIVAMVRVVSSDNGKKSGRRMLLSKDIKLLYKTLKENPDVAMVIFDPISGFYGGADGNSHKEIRPIMEALAEVCRNTGVTVVAIMHENRRKDVTALERVLGASAVGQVFRAAFRFSADPKNKGGYIMACSKTNYKVRGGLRYAIEDTEVRLDDGTVAADIGRVVWGETHNESADDVIQQAAEAPQEEPGLLAKMKFALMKELGNGRKLISDLHRTREALGVEMPVFYKVKRQLRLVTTDSLGNVLTPEQAKGKSGLYWSLPGDSISPLTTSESPMADIDVL